ncbi:polyprenyl synthetase family protein [Paracoccus aerodenitrificans]|uniref:polyprenyl synthetase family protein n=1 Tax=Paracoccus aerodenitrificans TaxID=3017781 RepID=UPI0022EFF901|nr:farnesyl diphosphate synthase [Paracoccus aerodenitrificans]WBU65773.1 polyprenyl synthetase family protein [Paracoccus aerodenitrificans]
MLPRMEEIKQQVEAALDTAMSDLPAGDLADAMRYACVGGKKMRAFLVMESARLHGVADEAALPVAAAVEALHAYSLVHDDLPAMDNDDLRRGMPTVHIQWSEATAILAGDALQTLAFRLLSDPAIGDAEARLRLIPAFARAVGGNGMVHGQMLDIAAEQATTPLDLAGIKRMQAAKTGALIIFAAEAGALIAGDDGEALRDYAANLGLAFQIHDDVLDVTGDEETIGKRVGKDAQAGKATFVSLLGLETARSRAAELTERAVSALSPYGDKADNLRELARFVIDRQS